MADPGTWAAVITLAAAATSAGVAYDSAQKQNKAAHRSADAANANAVAQSKQVNSQADLERKKELNRAQMIRGRIRAAAAGAGFDDSGSYGTLLQQTAMDAQLNTGIIETNRQNQLARTASGLDADLANLNSHLVNPVLQSFTAGMLGASTGLNVSSAAGLLDPVTASTGTPGAVPPINQGLYTGRSGRVA